jgi:hypothetical protein
MHVQDVRWETVGRVLNLHLATRGCWTIDLYAMEPFCAAAIPDTGASLSILPFVTASALPSILRILRQAAAAVEEQHHRIGHVLGANEDPLLSPVDAYLFQDGKAIRMAAHVDP